MATRFDAVATIAIEHIERAMRKLPEHLQDDAVGCALFEFARRLRRLPESVDSAVLTSDERATIARSIQTGKRAVIRAAQKNARLIETLHDAGRIPSIETRDVHAIDYVS